MSERMETALQPAPPQLAERDLAILLEMGRADETAVAFQGLRRRLQVHQQALIRALRRLEQRGLVQRDAAGYRLTDKGHGALQGRHPPSSQVPTLGVARALLPAYLNAHDVAAHLSRRWFQHLRWYGRSDGPGETTLIWLTEPEGAQVRVRIVAGALHIEVETMPQDPGREFRVARGLVNAVADLYGMRAVPTAGYARGTAA